MEKMPAFFGKITPQRQVKLPVSLKQNYLRRW